MTPTRARPTRIVRRSASDIPVADPRPGERRSRSHLRRSRFRIGFCNRHPHRHSATFDRRQIRRIYGGNRRPYHRIYFDDSA